MTSADLHTMTGAYAVHALDTDERREFERHLKVCSACAQEVHEFRETAARLATAVSETPTAELKRRVMDGIATVRQLPPEVPVGDAAPTAKPGRGKRFTTFALAACLAAIGALGGVAVNQYQDARKAERAVAAQRERGARIEAVVTAPDAVQASAPVTGGGTGRVIVSRALDETVVVMTGLPKLSNDRVYQGWYNDNGHMRSMGLIRPGSALIASAIDRATGVGVTVEPPGGSAEPSGDPIVLIDFPAVR
ncbi:anti-sigma factor [Streptomyces sp. SID3343]|uniref:anti-sigma factor n=1 Tax=Streptomyces sp. SID3343 TaxID=2690260 RepID=UPI0013692378|nr:anti-sigma factor [Streptomyces sp. SID3343]MYW00273.1 anti-sigma factor [Streptomyces sp. SID3343]